MQNLTEAQNILSTMTVKELRDTAREIHKAANDVTIPGYSKMVKAELIRQLSFEDAWYFAEMLLSLNETADILADDDTMEAIAEAEAETEADESAETGAGKSDAVGDAVSAMLDQDAPNRIRFDADESTVDALVTRDAPGLGFVNLGTDENNVAAVRRIRNRYELLTNSGDVIRAGSIAKAVKRWAKRVGVTVARIETVKQF